jgi:uncharacterized protein (DUF433 family)
LRFLDLVSDPGKSAACIIGGSGAGPERLGGPAGTLDGVDLTGLIDVRPGVRSGKPCFVGTRIAVYDVLDYLASGMTRDEILADFPELTEAHIRATLEFAALRERRLATPA